MNIVRQLLTSGANPNNAGVRRDVATMSTISAMHAASANGETEMVTLLLDHGAVLNVNEGEGIGTALHIASGYGWIQTALALIARGASIHWLDGDKMTPLCVAAHQRCLPMVMSLIDSGHAPVDGQHEEFPVALFLASQGGFVEIIHALLARGANINRVDRKYGTTG